MELKKWKELLPGFLSKYKYAAVILLLGMVLMLLPGRETAEDPPPSEPGSDMQNASAQQQLAQILSSIEGAGEVEVLLSYASGEKTIYQTDTNTAANGEDTSHRSDTVTVTDADRNQTGLVTQVDPAVYLGAVIVCQGADDPSVRLAIVDAVSKYTGLGSNQISVLKMK